MREHSYGITVQTELSVEEAEQRVREALAAEGFGILTEIDIAAVLDEKIGVKRPPYKILGACNPKLANQALGAEIEIGLLLPCNVIIYEEDGATVVGAMEPRTMSELTGNEGLREVAEQARSALVKALSAL